ncbi:MAG: M48 family metallopeptidase [Patescibacteria group bacterium]
MSTLYSKADSNIRKTWFLITFFLFLVISLSWVFSYILEDQSILLIGSAFSVFFSFSSFWFSDKIVLALSSAKLIEKQDNPELYRLVENLCIASGLPFPKIYIIQDNQPNAFATGRDENHAVIAVTSGLLEKLERVELEGVIAHELSHIGNKDMLLGSAMVALFGLVSNISNYFLRINFRSRRDSSRNKNSVLVIFGILVAIIAPLIASLVRFAISRQREFLADASAALLTRYPEGLASALEKISVYPESLKSASSATSHLYIANPLRGETISSLFMTHPPVEERIRILREMKN